jgi:hypothetical protein
MSTATLHPLRKPPARLLFSVDYDAVSPRIECHADKAFARVFKFEEYCHPIIVLAFDDVEAKALADPIIREIRHQAHLSLAADYEMTCWCGAEGKVSELYDHTGLESGCGGTGSLNCHCGGDLCVCHYHGETECPGCTECEGPDDDFDDRDEDEE